MQGWQTTYLGMRELPRVISGFELQAFFTFSQAERELSGARRVSQARLGIAHRILAHEWPCARRLSDRSASAVAPPPHEVDELQPEGARGGGCVPRWDRWHARLRQVRRSHDG